MPENNLPTWRQELKSSREKEGKSPSNRWIQLATVNDNNEPRLRTVVFRGWKTESSMLIFTDRRSEKIKHLTSNPNAEILWIFFKRKTQFRFKGKIRELMDTSNYWHTLSEHSKKSWFWEYPGKNIKTEPVSSFSIPTNLNKPKSFVVLQFEIFSVDMLKLQNPVHRRFLWKKRINEWNKVEINP